MTETILDDDGITLVLRSCPQVRIILRFPFRVVLNLESSTCQGNRLSLFVKLPLSCPREADCRLDFIVIYAFKHSRYAVPFSLFLHCWGTMSA